MQLENKVRRKEILEGRQWIAAAWNDVAIDDQIEVNRVGHRSHTNQVRIRRRIRLILLWANGDQFLEVAVFLDKSDEMSLWGEMSSLSYIPKRKSRAGEPFLLGYFCEFSWFPAWWKCTRAANEEILNNRSMFLGKFYKNIERHFRMFTIIAYWESVQFFLG